jgi:hypothetical protein
MGLEYIIAGGRAPVWCNCCIHQSKSLRRTRNDVLLDSLFVASPCGIGARAYYAAEFYTGCECDAGCVLWQHVHHTWVNGQEVEYVRFSFWEFG